MDQLGLIKLSSKTNQISKRRGQTSQQPRGGYANTAQLKQAAQQMDPKAEAWAANNTGLELIMP